MASTNLSVSVDMAATNHSASDKSVSEQVLQQVTKVMSFRKREPEQITPAEKQHMEALPKYFFFLYHPPYFYVNRDDCGEEIHAGHVSKWSTFIIVETLLATLTIQPLVAVVSINGWQYDVYGVLWGLALLGSFSGLFVNAALLGALFHCPRKLAWIWMCEVGSVSELPIVLMWISTLLSFLALGYTIWALYGLKVAMPCVVAGLGSIAVTTWLMARLRKALQVTYKLD